MGAEYSRPRPPWCILFPASIECGGDEGITRHSPNRPSNANVEGRLPLATLKCYLFGLVVGQLVITRVELEQSQQPLVKPRVPFTRARESNFV
jgi:hypothetical protein